MNTTPDNRPLRTTACTCGAHCSNHCDNRCCGARGWCRCACHAEVYETMRREHVPYLTAARELAA